jgi:translation elongation factor EF-Tu-like GTPase
MSTTFKVEQITYIDGRATVFHGTLKEGTIKTGQKMQADSTDISFNFSVRAIQDKTGQKLLTKVSAGTQASVLTQKCLPRAILNNCELLPDKTADYRANNMILTDSTGTGSSETPWWQFWKK